MRALVLLCINYYTQFDVPSFTYSTYMISVIRKQVLPIIFTVLLKLLKVVKCNTSETAYDRDVGSTDH